MKDFEIGDKIVFAKNVWRGRTVLFTGTVKNVTPETLIVTDLEDRESVTEELYSYKRNGEIRVIKTKAYNLEG